MVKFTPKEIKFLKKNEGCRVATSSGRMPHIAPVTYYFEDGSFYFATDYDTKKYSNLKKNRNIAISVDIYSPGKHKAVVVQGTASFIEKGSEFERLYRIFYKNYAWVRAMPWKEGEAPFVRVVPQKKASWGIG
ncbi:MAG: pyridoxamine 5'-phosphate oxidase family protein [Thaumarchaeota archaeon]|nr:pyridoxamine 5'-phosphate oxidase family protein [Nitrososphaerota archaeon]